MQLFKQKRASSPVMLNFIAYTQIDTSENELKDVTANITGDIVDLPAGPLAFAVGIEHREQEGSSSLTRWLWPATPTAFPPHRWPVVSTSTSITAS